MNSKKSILILLLSAFIFSYTGASFAGVVASTADLPATPDYKFADNVYREEMQHETNLVANNSEVTSQTQNPIIETSNTNSIGYKTIKFENLPKIKNYSSNIVNINENNIVIPHGDVFKVAFTQDFSTKNLKVGDKVIFNLPNGLYTQEGRLLLPQGTQMIATVNDYTPPKWFNRNVKVMLDFNEILVPNTTPCQMGACVYGKYNALQPSPWATVAKPVIWTAGMFGVGAGLGAAIGAAASAAATGCLCIGMPVGGGVGLVIGLVTPGLHYKAKAGKQIPIMLTQDLVLVQK